MMDTTLRILVLEDSPIDAELMERELRKSDIVFSSRRVENRQAFLRELSDFAPDIILADNQLPQFDGVSALRLVQEKAPFIPVIIVTGSLNEEVAVNCMKAGAADYVLKESLTRLGPAVQSALQKEQAELALQESENRYRSLFENMLNGLAYCRMLFERNQPQDFIYLNVNKAFESLTGLKNVVGKKASEVIPGIRESDPELLEIYGRVALTGTPEQFEMYLEALDMWFSISVYSPQKEYFVAVFDVITERKRAEEEIRALNVNLEQRIAERTAELHAEIAVRQRAEQELLLAKEFSENASRAKSGFLANMSHELRTPLNAILGYAQLLQDADNLSARQRHSLETIRTSGEHLLTLINEILDLSKIEAGHLELQSNEFRLQSLLREIVDMCKIRAEEKGLVFVTDIDPDLPEGIRADEKRLREVLLNLLGNAIKFTEQGRVTLHVATYYPVETPGMASLHFQISDTGIGIAPEDCARIFEAFQQVGGKSRETEGTGLGLAISKRLVTMMGGDLSVSSVVGQGTTFRFTLQCPVIDHVAAPIAGPSRKITGYTGPRRTILIADDEHANRGLLMSILFPLGFRIAEVADGQECLEKAVRAKPDLILLDLRMPVLDGFSTVERLRTMPEFRDVPVIAISASVFEEIRQRALSVGFDDFLFKPLRQEQLLSALQHHLRLEWVYADRSAAPPVLSGSLPLPNPFAVPPLPAAEARYLYALAVRGNHKKVLEQLARIEQFGSEFRPLVEKFRALAERFDTDAIVTILDEMGTTNA